MRLRRLTLATAATCTVLLAAPATPAYADTSTAQAQAVSLTLLGGTAATPVSSASNNGDQPTQTGTVTPGLGLLGQQPLITAGVLVQQAVADKDGTSTACAGLAGNGGAIAVGPDGTCTVAGGGGIVIDLLGLATIKADAIIASCRAVAGQPPVASVSLANAHVLLLGLPLLNLSVNTGPNTGLDIPGVATLLINARSAPHGTGSVGATALQIKLLGSAVAAEIGTVTCGQNAVTPPTPALPAPALPIAGAAAGIALWFGRHRLREIASRLRG